MKTENIIPGLDVLSIGHGDIKIDFDDKNPQEAERAKRIIADMLRRGYSLFIPDGSGGLKRVKRFDAKVGTYFIADGAKVEPSAEKVKKPKLSAVPMAKTRATVVGRSAGG